MLGALNHPNIAAIYGVEQDGDLARQSPDSGIRCAPEQAEARTSSGAVTLDGLVLSASPILSA